jgi:hypothetical protein
MTPRGTRADTKNPAIEYLLNVRDMIQVAVALIRKGYAPYCPGLDAQYFLSLPSGETISEEAIKDISMAFLERSDIMVLLPGWEKSVGCRAEVMRAIVRGIPTYHGVKGVPDES